MKKAQNSTNAPNPGDIRAAVCEHTGKEVVQQYVEDEADVNKYKKKHGKDNQ